MLPAQYVAGGLSFTLHLLYINRVKAPGLKNADIKKVSSVKLLGGKGKIDRTQTDDELIIRKPSALPNFTTLVFAVK